MSYSDTVPEALDALIYRRLSEVNTCMPGRVHKYNEETGSADIIPLLAQTVILLDGEQEDRYLPLIKNVQIFELGSGPIEITFPLQVGSLVTIIFSQVSIDRWKSSLTPEKKANTGSTRRFDPSDAIAFPGIKTLRAPSKQRHATDLVLAAPGVRIGDINATDGVARLSDLKDLHDAMSLAVATGPPASDGGLALMGRFLSNWTPTASDKVKVE